MKVIDAIKFVLKYRKGKAFIDWSIPQLTMFFVYCIQCGSFFWAQDFDGNITGVLVGHLFDNGFHVDNVLSIKRGNMPGFINAIVKRYPEITKITTLRHGRYYHEYPVNNRMFERFMKGTR